jgi:hypothetical protein
MKPQFRRRNSKEVPGTDRFINEYKVGKPVYTAGSALKLYTLRNFKVTVSQYHTRLILVDMDVV